MIPKAMDCRYVSIMLALAFLFGFAPAQAQGDLNVFLVASSDVLGAGDAIDYTLMVSNTSTTTLNNVNLDVQLPGQITRFFTSDVIRSALNCGNSACDPNELVAWNVGTLAPGENLRLTYFTRIADSSPPGNATTTIIASADNISDIILMHDVVVDASPLLRLSLVPGPGPAIAGAPFTYTLTYGNVGATSPAEVVLTMPVPDGTSFQSATRGGTESEGIVTWVLGTVGVGAGGRVEVTVVPDESLIVGATLEAEAALDSGEATELVVRSEAVTEVGLREVLRFDYGVSQNAAGRSGSLYLTFTATNASATDDLTGVSVGFRLPQQVTRFFTSDVIGSGLNCGNSACDPNEVIVWEVGTLAPGQGRTIIMPTGIASNAQQGEVLRAFYLATADGLEDKIGGSDLIVDPSPVARLQVIPDPGPAIPGESFAYTILFSNIGFQPTDLALQMTLPEGTTFNSATGGVAEMNGVVRWQAGNVAVEAAGRVRVTVDVDPALPTGSLLMSTAQLDTGSATEYVVHASTATPVGEESALEVTYTAEIEFGSPGDSFDLTMEAGNTGQVDFTDTAVEFRLPQQVTRFFTSDVIGSGLNCGNSACDPNEVIVWEVGTLAPGQGRTIIMPTGIAGNAQQGSFLLSPTMVTATGSGESVRYLYILLGDVVDLDAPATPLDLAATPGEGEVSLSWTANTEDDLGGYRLYRDTAPGASTLVATIGEGATSYVDEGLGLGTYYYRLTAVDASNNESGFSNEVEVTVITVDAEGESSLPTAFALHGSYPNPFRGAATVSFDVPSAERVVLTVYSALGERVAVLADAPFPAGRHRAEWDAEGLASGVYIVRIRAGTFTATRKLVLLR